jgi:cbb3-type cytochrome oxidase maturation protein
MTSLVLTIPLTLLLGGALLWLVVRAARRGEFDDWEGPAARHAFDDDRTPELETPDAGGTTPGAPGGASP